MESEVSPAPKRPSIRDTGNRKPRIQGLPPQISERLLIRRDGIPVFFQVDATHPGRFDHRISTGRLSQNQRLVDW